MCVEDTFSCHSSDTIYFDFFLRQFPIDLELVKEAGIAGQEALRTRLSLRPQSWGPACTTTVDFVIIMFVCGGFGVLHSGPHNGVVSTLPVELSAPPEASFCPHFVPFSHLVELLC